MKKFLLKSGAFIAIILLIYALMVISALFILPVNTTSYNYAHHVKMERLDTLSSPRVVLVAGISLAFGVNSSRISDTLGVNVQNTALHAGIGLRFMLDDVISRLRPGDVIVIMTEYPQFYNDYEGSDSGTLTDAVIYSGTEAWKLLDMNQLVNVLAGIPTHLLGRMRPVNTSEWTYSAVNFNKWGDESAHWSVTPPGVNNPVIPTEGKLNEAYTDDFANKIESIRNRGCEVRIFWPITIRSNYEANRGAIREIQNALSQRGIRFDSKPDALVQPDSFAFDTPYHLNGEGVMAATDSLIQLLSDCAVNRRFADCFLKF